MALKLLGMYIQVITKETSENGGTLIGAQRRIRAHLEGPKIK